MVHLFFFLQGGFWVFWGVWVRGEGGRGEGLGESCRNLDGEMKKKHVVPHIPSTGQQWTDSLTSAQSFFQAPECLISAVKTSFGETDHRWYPLHSRGNGIQRSLPHTLQEHCLEFKAVASAQTWQTQQHRSWCAHRTFTKLGRPRQTTTTQVAEL